MKKEQLMEKRKFLICGLMISLIICFLSCNNNENIFYNKIKDNNDCMIACEIKYDEKKPITIVMEKTDIVYEFKNFNLSIDDDFIIKTIKSQNPFLVPKELYYKLYGSQIIEQVRIDSLMNLGTDSLLTPNKDGIRFLRLDSKLENVTLMEELYTIKKLFEQNILLRRDCESGFYLEIR